MSSSSLIAINPRADVPREFKLDNSEVFLGRAPENQVAIAETKVSTRHASLRLSPQGWELRDLDSANGTFVNGRRVTKPVLLNEGDELRLATVRFLFWSGSPRTGTLVPESRSTHAFRRRRPVMVATFLFAIFAAGFGLSEYLSAKGRNPLEVAGAEAPKPLAASPRVEAPIGSAESVGKVANSSSSHAPAPVAPLMPSVPSGSAIERVNVYRAMAKLPPVKENTAMSGGDFAHVRFLVKKYDFDTTELGGAAHTEDASDPWFSPAGLAAAEQSDVTTYTGPMKRSPTWAIDGWMTTPFHRLPLLNPALKDIGYAEYCENGECAAALNSIRARSSEPRIFETPVKFPGDGSKISLRSFDGSEWPPPLPSCPGYSAPTGLPISIQFGQSMAPHVTQHSISKDGVELEHCYFDAASYSNSDDGTQKFVRDILEGNGAALMIPREPFEPGAKYDVSITADGRPYKWSFSVAPEAPLGTPPTRRARRHRLREALRPAPKDS